MSLKIDVIGICNPVKKKKTTTILELEKMANEKKNKVYRCSYSQNGKLL